MATYHIRRAWRMLDAFRKTGQRNLGEAAARAAKQAEHAFRDMESYYGEPGVKKHQEELALLLEELATPQ
ncbi:hypothetical protein WMF45_39000 [Sorangium sp. So ce448]|uniref:hypothetical protein n=1 Tax=Sorangium sp. So ce448 TaxID=3133314 RepID=UPI003F648938